MSVTNNSGLDKYGAEPFEQEQYGTGGVEGVNPCGVVGAFDYTLHHSCLLMATVCASSQVSPNHVAKFGVSVVDSCELNRCVQNSSTNQHSMSVYLIEPKTCQYKLVVSITISHITSVQSLAVAVCRTRCVRESKPILYGG